MKNVINRALAAKKRFIALLLAIVASVGTMFAASGTCGKNLTWDLTNGVLTISGTGAMTDDYFDGEAPWYSYRLSITEVSIGNSVTSIGYWAFSGCSGLTSVTIPNSVTSIGLSAFWGCTGLTSITIPNSVTSIGSYAFVNCSGLISVTIPNSVTGIGNEAFSGCSGLTAVHINDIAAWCNISFSSSNSNPLYYAKHLYLNDSEITNLIIPDGVTSIRNYAFYNCSGLTSVTIPNSVTSIGSYAFYNCSGLTSITIPSSVTSVGAGAFWECNNLSTIYMLSSIPPTIQNNFQHIGDSYDTFPSFPDNVKIYVPCGSKEQYEEKWTCTYDCVSYHIQGQPTQYSITVNYNSIVGFVDKVIPQTACDGPATITATPNYGYHFVQWSDGDINNPRTVQLTQDTTFTAEFAKNKYTITAVSNNLNYGIVTGGKTAEYMDEVTLTATPQIGHHFKHWVCGANYYTNSTITVVVQQDETYTAVFGRNMYDLTVNADPSQGYVTAPTQAEFLQEVKMTATPNSGYEFIQWNDGETANPRTVQLTQDTTFTAEFAKAKYTIATAVNDAERGTASGDAVVEYLASVKLTATPNYGYHFTNWKNGSNTYTVNPLTVTATANATYTAYFAKNTYNINVRSENSSFGTVSAPKQADYLNWITLTANATTGYHFVQWSDGDSSNPRYIQVTCDTTLSARFALTTSGQCGTDLFWNYENGMLSFSGSGDMYNYTETTVPWKLFLSDIKTVVFASGMTSIGNYACANMTKLEQINIPSKVRTIGNYAFANINNRKIRTIVLPSEIISIGAYAFAGNTYIEQIDFGKNLETIGAYAFQNCSRVIAMTCLAESTPDVETDALASISSDAELYVFKGSIQKYKVDPNWKRFVLKELGATETSVTDNDVKVEADDNTATLTWPTSEAETYTIQITKDGAVFCTLIFDKDGHLTGIAFAPSRKDAPQAPAATLVATGMQFTVTGLNSATKYRFSVTAKDAGNNTVAYYDGEFKTTGVATGIDQGPSDQGPRTKVLENGVLYLMYEGRMYDVRGQVVK